MSTIFAKQKPTQKTALTKEEAEILENINKLLISLQTLYQNYEFVVDPKLIDSYIYEMSALYAKYDYYVKLCKEKGIAVTNN